MHRCCSGFCLVLTILLVVALTGCLGKSTPNTNGEGVESVTLSPSNNLSLEVGATQVFSASAKNGNGGVVSGTIQYIVTVPTGSNGVTPLNIATNGNACAGTWDPAVSICTPGSPGIAIVVAVIDGVQSPPTTVYVHYHIDSLQISQGQPQPPQYDCFSQGQTWIYQGLAYHNGIDITNSVGQLNWSTTNVGVLTTNTNPTLPPPQPPLALNQVQITASSPGITNFYANVSGTTSNSIPLTTCLVQYVRLQVQGNASSSVIVNNGTSVPLLATAVDTLGYALKKPPLTWSTNSPEVVNLSSANNTTGSNTAAARSNLGGGDVTVSCTPPSCNIGVLPGMPVYASGGPLSGTNPLIGYGSIGIQVTTATQPPTYTAWAATDQCGPIPGCTSVMFALQPTQGGVNPIGATITIPRTPNSFMANYLAATRFYIGSNLGLMYSDVSNASGSATPVSNATTPCNVALCGKVIAISNDGKQVVVSDDVSQTPQVYIYNSNGGGGAGSTTDLVLPNVASAAAFSPDLSKIFILTNAGTMYVYSTTDALTQVPIPSSGTDAAFSADSSFAYVAGTVGSAGLLSAFSTCATPAVPSANLGSIATSGVPLQIFPSPNIQVTQDSITQNILVLEPPNIQILSAQYSQNKIPDGQYTCNPPNVTLSSNPNQIYNLGQGAFTPIYTRLAGDGSEMVVVGKYIPAILVFNVATGLTTSLALEGGAYPLAASASTDGSQFYVAACDQYQNNNPTQTCLAGSVHIVSTALGDHQQVPYVNSNNTNNNMCSDQGGTAPLCTPDIVAIKPQ